MNAPPPPTASRRLDGCRAGRLSRRLICAAALVFAAPLGACGEQDPFGPGFDPDPGRCETDPAGASALLGDPALAPTGLAASCRFVVWLAPAAGGGAAAAQVYAHDLGTGATFRTTDPRTDAFGPGVTPQRWGPALHGFWLAYAEPEAVVLENLARFERVRLTPAPRPGGRVAIWYPFVAWEAPGEAAGSVLVVADMTTGDVRVVTPEGQTAVDPSLCEGRLVYTLYAQDASGAGDGLQGEGRVERLALADPAALPVPVAPAAGDHRAGAIYGDLITYVERVGAAPRLAAVDAETLAPLATLSGDAVPSFNLAPSLGEGVVAWVNGGATPTVALWWPRLGLNVVMAPWSPAPRVAVGERVVVLGPARDGVHALSVAPADSLRP
jgi:hypothetical protein